jgi:N-acetylglucosamine-6-phosphate deacetylase
LQDQGIAVSYGHSDASFEQAYNSFEKNQVDLVTHWGNAMKVADKFKQRATDEFSLKILEHEDPGSLSGSGIGLAALKHPKVKLMIIVGSKADGDEHLDPLIVKKLVEIKKNQLILVSDSVAYSGPRPPDQLVGGLVSLKKHHQNALNIGLTQDDLDKSTELAAQIIQKA